MNSRKVLLFFFPIGFMSQQISIRPLDLAKDLDSLIDVWNQTLPETFSMDAERLRGYLDRDPNYDPQGSLAAFESSSNRLVGYVLGKRWLILMEDMGDTKENQANRDKGMGIAIVFVHSDFQKLGIGTRLMIAIEKWFADNGGKIYSISQEPGLHMLPGVPEILEDCLEFFDQFGYGEGGIATTIDIIGDISNYEEFPSDNPKLLKKIEANHANGYDVVGYSPDIKEATLAYMKKNLSGDWYWKCKIQMEEPTVAADELQLLIKRTGEEVRVHGFAVTATQASINVGPATILQSQGRADFGGLGPIGIEEEVRGSQGLGAMLLHDALYHLKLKGVKTVLIDWTGHRLLKVFYGPAGFKLYMNYISPKKKVD